MVRIILLLLPCVVSSFVAPRPFLRSTNEPLCMGIERLEFTIRADGRVEEKVTGVKGGNCNIITEEINKQLGKVIDTKATEELYENEIVLDQKVELSNGEESSSSSSSSYSSW